MFKIISPKGVVAAAAVSMLTACVSTPPTRSIFQTPGIDKAQWARISDECSYEAEKATASADPKTAVSYAWRRVFNMCAELKGATFVGRVTMTDEQWQAVWIPCNAEAKAAVAGRPASHSRDQLQEDIELECMKRRGVVFSQSLYP